MVSREVPVDDNFCYVKALGWYEFDDDGDKVPSAIAVTFNYLGYSVFRLGQNVEHLKWLFSKEEAIEWAVDRSRKEIAEHEMRQVDRD